MADIATTRIFTDGEKGITASKMNDIIAGSSIQTSFVSGKPTVGTVNPTDTMLVLTAGGTYAQAPFSTVTNSVAAQLPSSDPEIWSVRLRSYNAIGNPNFEIDQKTIGVGLANPVAGQSWQDRWFCGKAGTMAIKAQQGSGGNPVVPGTNFRISANYAAITLTTQQTVLGASDHWEMFQYIEGSAMRELISDVHSCSLLVQSSVAGLKFSVTFRDNPVTKSLTKLCTIPNASTWTLVSLPNLPVWPAGNFAFTPGVVGYELRICLAAGSTVTAPAADTWQTGGNFFGAPGQDNFASKPVNSAFFCALVQHEPGSQCSTFMDLPFDQNLMDCTRYFQKSYDIGLAPGAISNNGDVSLVNAVTTQSVGPVRFGRRLAKAPTMTAYNPVTGAGNSMRQTGGVDFAVSGFNSVGETGFDSVNATGLTANSYCRLHYIADTGF